MVYVNATIMTKIVLKKFPQLVVCGSGGIYIILSAGLLFVSSMSYAQESTTKFTPPNKVSDIKASDNDAYEKLLHRADSLIKAGNSAAAYNLLEPFEFEYAGNAKFDYLLGIAALDSGKGDKATLALERALTVNPSSLAARLEMGRAYYQLGDMKRAKTEFQLVQQLGSSAEGRNISQKYLDEIAQRADNKTIFSRGYIEATVAYDSNVNNSSSQAQVFVDAIASYTTLDPINVKTADQYAGVASGGKITYKPNSTIEIFVGADMRKRNYNVQKNFDALGLDGHAGIAFQVKSERFLLSALSGQSTLGGSHYSDASGLKIDWRHIFSPSNQFTFTSQQLQLKFADVAMQANDYTQQVGSIGWQHILPSGNWILSGNIYSGNEQDTSSLMTSLTPTGGRTDGAKNLHGFRIGAQIALTDKTSLFANSGLQYGNYSRINPLFLHQRSDRLQDVMLGTNWHWDKQWTMRTLINYTKNDSNISIYEYEKLEVSMSVRREFR